MVVALRAWVGDVPHCFYVSQLELLREFPQACLGRLLQAVRLRTATVVVDLVLMSRVKVLETRQSWSDRKEDRWEDQLQGG